MSLSQISFIILTVLAMAAGQILFKMAANGLVFSVDGFLGSLLNAQLIIALFIYFLATMMWLFVLKATPLRVAYPFVALAFFIVPILAHFLLDEALKWNTFAGAILIAMGVWLSALK